MRLNRNSLFLLIGSIIVIGLALVFMSGNSTAPDDDSPDDLASDTLDVYEAVLSGDIMALTVTDNDEENGGTTVISQADDGAWQLDETADPQPGTLAQGEIDAVMMTLAGLQSTDRFVPEDGDLSVYGLDAPAYTISFSTTDETYTLYPGNTNPGGSRYYALIGDDTETVHLLNDVSALNDVTALALAPPYIVEPTPTPVPQVTIPGMLFQQFPLFTVTELTISDNADDSRISLRQDDNLNWMTDDDEMLDSQIVSIAAGVLSSLEAVDALPAADIANFGLDEPAYTIVATTTTTEATLNIGTEDVSGTRYYVQVNDLETIAVIDKDSIEILLDVLRNPPYLPEATPEMTAEATE